MVTDTNCNPSFFGGHNSTEVTEGASNMSVVVLGVDWKSIVSLVIFLACVLYARFICYSFSHFSSVDSLHSSVLIVS